MNDLFISDNPEIAARVISIRAEARRMVREMPTLRYGQCVFSLVHDLNPGKAAIEALAELDPFYDDSRVEAFLQAVYGDIPK